MADRFFCSDLSTPVATLSAAEAHHAIHVLRVSSGETIHLFDGCGTTCSGVVETVGRRDVTVSVTECVRYERSPDGWLTLAASPPKGDRLKWMIEKLTELGVDRYVPLITERSFVDSKKINVEKLHATVVNASKQCGRHWLMEIGAPTDLRTLLSSPDPSRQLYVAHPYRSGSMKNSAEPSAASSHIVLIGPEGGFTDDEVSAVMSAEARQIEWPGSILRVETAAIMAAIHVRCLLMAR